MATSHAASARPATSPDEQAPAERLGQGAPERRSWRLRRSRPSKRLGSRRITMRLGPCRTNDSVRIGNRRTVGRGVLVGDMTELRTSPPPKSEWRVRLSPAEFRVLRQGGTEPAFTGEYVDTKTQGAYALPGLRREAVRQRHQVRLALRLAVVRRGDSGHDPLHRGPLVRHGSGRGALLHVRLAPWSPIRR